MNSGTVTWILIGIGAVLAGLLLLLATPPETAPPPAQTAEVSLSSAPVVPVEQGITEQETERDESYWESVPCPTSDACPSKPEAPCQSPCVEPAPAAGGCSEIPQPCPCEEGCEQPFLGLLTPPTERPHPRDRPKPVIDKHYPSAIDEGSILPLLAQVSNPACAPVCFVWSVSKGWLEDPDTLTPIYHAPMSDRAGEETVTITFTIYDHFGERSFDQIRISIRNLDYTGPPVP